MDVCAVDFDADGRPVTSGAVTDVTITGAHPVPGPEGYAGAVLLGPGAVLTAHVDPSLVTPDVALEMMVRIRSGAGGSLVSGGLGITLVPDASRFRADVQVPTSAGPLEATSSDLLVETWFRWVVAFTGLDLLSCLNDAVTSTAAVNLCPC